MKTKLAVPIFALLLAGRVVAGIDDPLPWEERLSPSVKAMLHVGLSGAAAYTACGILTLIRPSMPLEKRCILGVAVGLVPGILKESYDRWIRDYDFDFEDIIADGAGALGGGGLFYFSHYFKEQETELHVAIGPRSLCFTWTF